MSAEKRAGSGRQLFHPPGQDSPQRGPALQACALVDAPQQVVHQQAGEMFRSDRPVRQAPRHAHVDAVKSRQRSSPILREPQRQGESERIVQRYERAAEFVESITASESA